MLNQTFEMDIRRLVWRRLFSHVCICCLYRWRCQQDWRCCWTCPLLTGAASFFNRQHRVDYLSQGDSSEARLEFWRQIVEHFCQGQLQHLQHGHAWSESLLSSKASPSRAGGRQVDFPPTPCGTEHRLHQSKGFLKQFSFTNTNFTTLSKDFFSKYKICTSTFKKNINPRLVMNEAFTSLNCAGQHGRSPPNSIGCQFDEISYDKCQLVSDESLQFNDNS